MSVQTSRRLGRYAAISLASLPVCLGAWLLGDGLVILALSVPFVLAWGPFQAEIAMNPGFDDVDRQRWRIALYVLPWLITLYWYRHVRAARPQR